MRNFYGRPVSIAGIDPGVSTGVAIATMFDPVTHQLTSEYHYITATCTEPQQVWEFIRPPIQVLILEKFAASLIDKYGLHTVEIVGGVKALCAEHDIIVELDTPQQRRPYMELARSLVPHREDIPPHEQRHEVDALSHVVRYLYQHQYITSLKVER